MRRIVCAVLFAFIATMGAAAASDGLQAGLALPGCEIQSEVSSEAAPTPSAPVQLAQSGCRSDCSSRRSYCLSSCSGRSQCRSICNDNYQSCLAGCR